MFLTYLQSLAGQNFPLQALLTLFEINSGENFCLPFPGL